MIIERKGDLLQDDAQLLVHQTNCKGVMGGGIALQVKKQYPVVFAAYDKLCRKYTAQELLGGFQVLEIAPGRYICNLFAQDGYGRWKRMTDYDAFETALKRLVPYMKERGMATVAFPKYIGCGLAGGDWEIVYQIIRKYFAADGEIECRIIEFDR